MDCTKALELHGFALIMPVTRENDVVLSDLRKSPVNKGSARIRLEPTYMTAQ